ncbi:MAG: lipid A biosynthesis acyltransferase [Burkholderiales bacterium]|nr:lipid A biosynthesis acyltransferase [Burkholderiales bacterium]
MLTRFALGLIWLAQWLPAGAIARLGRGIGWLGYRLAVPRRKVVLTNLRLCFPGLTEAERIALARRHFSALGRAIMERAVMWYAPLERVTQFVRLEAVEHFEAVRGRPVLLLAPHFVGLDMGGVRVAIAWRTASMYGKQKNPALDAAMRHGRERFGDPVLISRQDGIRPVVRALRDGFAFYYLPDMDFGPRESIFVPFFGVTTATVPALARLAQVSRARVVPVVTRQLSDGEGYAAKFYPAWEDFPSGDIDADTRRMNEFIEARVREMPEQYYWVHKRFKTRPAGEERIY